MNLNDFFDYVLLPLGQFNITVGNIILVFVILLLLFLIYRFTTSRFLPKFFKKQEVTQAGQRKILSLFRVLFLLGALLGVILGTGVDYELYKNANATFKVSNLLEAFLVFQAARLMDWIISKVLIFNYYRRRDEQLKTPISQADKSIKEKNGDRAVQSVVYVLALIWIVHALEINYTFNPGEEFEIRISNILTALLILLCARLISWGIIQLVLFGYYKKQGIDVGSQYAINQLLKYFTFVIAILFALQQFNITLTIIWGGAAALLVGLGFGIQQTFNDLVSGIILLFERTVEVGDWVQIDDMMGKVKRIGLRTSLVETRDNISVVVPNSKLIVENVINWSHYDNKARFKINVGVAYGSDTAIVKELLLRTARENEFILNHPKPFVRFIDFGSSSLDFELHFWSKDFARIEDIKSDMRFDIDRVFRTNNIEIPFPQRDVWFKYPKKSEDVEKQ